MDDEYTPRIVGFLCNWCSYIGADLAGVARLKVPPSIRIIRVMCSGRIDPLFVLKAFLKGVDGVMMMGCHPGECHYQKGNYNARRRFILLQKILESFGLEPKRLGIWWVSASEAPKYAEVTNDFAKEIKKIGPSPIANEIFL